MSTPAPIAPIRTTVGSILGTMHVHGTTPPLARAAYNLDVIDEI